MSYEVLARRFRPHSFDDVAGQKPVTTALRNAIRLERLPHAILLCGPRGVGKTTLARIVARALNCEQGPTETPCGKCDACTEIGSSASLDVQEIDAASNTGVDNVREIRDSIRYAAASGRHRIFIIDEVHMLSTAAFNALLKTLEEPPPRSLFILATTDPQKIPVTVLSRVQRFDLKRLSSVDALERLHQIAEAEQLDIDESVLRALVREGEGSLRDSLTLLDRLTSALGSKISEADATAILDLIDRRVLAAVLDPVLAGDAGGALAAVRSALSNGADPARLAGDLLAELRNLLVARLVDDPSEMIDASAEELAELRERAAPHSPETLQRLFRVLLTRNQDLTFAARPDHVVEMAVVRLATLPEAEALSDLIARLDGMDPGGPAGPGGGAGGGNGTRASGPDDRDGKGRGGKTGGAGKRSGPRADGPRPSADAKSEQAAPAPKPSPQPAAAPPAAAEPPAAAPEPSPVPAATRSDEPPPPEDDAQPAAVAEAPRRRAGKSRPVAQERGRGAERDQRERELRQQAKADPRVLEAAEILDAELVEVRILQPAPAGDGGASDGDVAGGV